VKTAWSYTVISFDLIPACDRRSASKQQWAEYSKRESTYSRSSLIVLHRPTTLISTIIGRTSLTVRLYRVEQVIVSPLNNEMSRAHARVNVYRQQGISSSTCCMIICDIIILWFHSFTVFWVQKIIDSRNNYFGNRNSFLPRMLFITARTCFPVIRKHLPIPAYVLVTLKFGSRSSVKKWKKHLLLMHKNKTISDLTG